MYGKKILLNNEFSIFVDIKRKNLTFPFSLGFIMIKVVFEKGGKE